MRLLLDESVPRPLIAVLREAGHDVMAIFEDARGMSDPKVVARGRRERRTVLTFDLGFGDLIYRDRLPPPAGIVLVRLPSTMPWPQMAPIILEALAIYRGWTGSFAVIEEQRVRLSPLPSLGSEPEGV